MATVVSVHVVVVADVVSVQVVVVSTGVSVVSVHVVVVSCSVVVSGRDVVNGSEDVDVDESVNGRLDVDELEDHVVEAVVLLSCRSSASLLPCVAVAHV